MNVVWKALQCNIYLEHVDFNRTRLYNLLFSGISWKEFLRNQAIFIISSRPNDSRPNDVLVSQQLPKSSKTKSWQLEIAHVEWLDGRREDVPGTNLASALWKVENCWSNWWRNMKYICFPCQIFVGDTYSPFTHSWFVKKEHILNSIFSM